MLSLLTEGTVRVTAMDGTNEDGGFSCLVKDDRVRVRPGASALLRYRLSVMSSPAGLFCIPTRWPAPPPVSAISFCDPYVMIGLRSRSRAKGGSRLHYTIGWGHLFGGFALRVAVGNFHKISEGRGDFTRRATFTK